MNKLETPEKELSPEEKVAAMERDISVEIEKRIMEKQVPFLMLEGKTKLEAQSKWISSYAEKYRTLFKSEKDKIIDMYKNDPNGTAEYIEKQLEAVTKKA